MIKLSIFILFSRGLTYCLESICKPRQGRNKWNMFLMGAAGKAGKGPLWSPNTFLFSGTRCCCCRCCCCHRVTKPQSITCRPCTDLLSVHRSSREWFQDLGDRPPHGRCLNGGVCWSVRPSAALDGVSGNGRRLSSAMLQQFGRP